MPESVDSQQPITSSMEPLEKPIAYEDKQAALGKEWADIYRSQPVNTAEIILRNPQVYSHDIVNLPEEMRVEWERLSAFADSVSTIAAVKPIDWGNTSGLDRIQAMVLRGEVKPEFRGTIGDIIEVSSDLFARSVKIAPGNTEYHQGNVATAESRLKNYRQPPPVSTPQQI